MNKGESGAPRPKLGYTQSHTKLGHGTKWPFPPTMSSKNPAARIVQGVMKETKPKSKLMSPLDQLRRK
jgi:hypothetical protein